ncbi:CaiB/BaiF CoA transferase family protein [Gordonia soli]|uniref:CaiB/BaiF family protein n=1 Tax=Gordonia soli NBRC 108243 TaxID=1223545 RepID=M0QDV3_9ACTN|nr:CoA transferase [Gordonia soli]GAC66755.1 CaiB/BaiF family protein [Gordonia soli NBRC 108243]
MTGALDGVVVADFSRVLAGPYATMLLADMGAEVIKIERPDVGDDTRQWGPPYDSSHTATYFTSVNRNKTSVSVDLGTPEGVEVAQGIVARADVLIENFRSGTMEKFGLGYDDLREQHPGLVYCSITGFGTDAGAGLPGYDLLLQAMGGLMSITGPDSSTPTKVGVAVVDVITGLHASTGILAALRHRDRTGEGQRVHIALLTALLSALSNQAAAYLGADAQPVAMGNRHPSVVPYETFPTADRPIALAVGTNRQFASLAEVLGHPDWADDPRYVSNEARVGHRDELIASITEALASAGAAEWTGRLSAVGVPAGPVNSLAEAFQTARDLGLDPEAVIPGSSARTVRNPIDLSATPVTYRTGPPELGEHGP